MYLQKTHCQCCIIIFYWIIITDAFIYKHFVAGEGGTTCTTCVPFGVNVM